MVLHNICIEHGLQWELEFDTDGEEDEYTMHPDSTTGGTPVFQSVVDQFLINYDLSQICLIFHYIFDIDNFVLLCFYLGNIRIVYT